MASFKDRTGQIWDLRITILMGRIFRERFGYSPAALVLTEEGINSLVEGDQADQKIIDLVWTCVERQANARNVNFETFFDDLMDNDTLTEAFDKCLDAIVDSLPNNKKEQGKKVLRILKAASDKVQQTVLTAIDNLDVTEVTDKIHAISLQKLNDGNSPLSGNVDSTPATIPSRNSSESPKDGETSN